MSRRFGLTEAVRMINEERALLVFPIKGKSEPKSLWSCFYPRSKMRWEWDEDGDDRVAKLWHLRAELAESQKVVYSKWYQGRATVFSKSILPQLLTALNRVNSRSRLLSLEFLSKDARNILEVLEENSPLSTKQLKKCLWADSTFQTSKYTRVMSELFSRGLVVGVGEVEDGAFPSLAMGATKSYFEKEWADACQLDLHSALASLEKCLGASSLLFKQILRHRQKHLNPPKESIGISKRRSEVLFEELL